MLKKLDHVGIAVEDLDEALKMYRDALGLVPDEILEVPERGLRIAFFTLGNMQLELLTSTDERGDIASFLKRNGPGLHHLAFLVEDVAESLRRLSEKGVRLIDEMPRRGGRGNKIGFLDPRAMGGILVELCEEHRE
ncbi:methylmalonyl-CoA epimerase [bacterium]|nr:methylmalonyl-CoA epimerase [bacterium]